MVPFCLSQLPVPPELNIRCRHTILFGLTLRSYSLRAISSNVLFYLGRQITVNRLEFLNMLMIAVTDQYYIFSHLPFIFNQNTSSNPKHILPFIFSFPRCKNCNSFFRKFPKHRPMFSLLFSHILNSKIITNRTSRNLVRISNLVFFSGISLIRGIPFEEN